MTTVALEADLVFVVPDPMHGSAWEDVKLKALRWAIVHAISRLVRRACGHMVRLSGRWPASDSLLDAYRRTALLT